MRQQLPKKSCAVKHGSIAHDYLVVTVLGLELGDLSMHLDHV
jgi:hypothetical protein